MVQGDNASSKRPLENENSSTLVNNTAARQEQVLSDSEIASGRPKRPKLSPLQATGVTCDDTTSLTVLEDHLVKKLRHLIHKHHTDTQDLYERILNSAVQHEEMIKLRLHNRGLVDSVNSSLRLLGSTMCMDEDLVVSRMLEAELLAKWKVEEKRLNKQTNIGYPLYPPMKEQGISNIAVEQVCRQHQRETLQLLAVAAVSGLTAVPEVAMNAVRAKNFHLVQSVNLTLCTDRSTKKLTEPELQLKLQRSEAIAVQLHLLESRRKHYELSGALKLLKMLHAMKDSNKKHVPTDATYFPSIDNNDTVRTKQRSDEVGNTFLETSVDTNVKSKLASQLVNHGEQIIPCRTPSLSLPEKTNECHAASIQQLQSKIMEIQDQMSENISETSQVKAEMRQGHSDVSLMKAEITAMRADVTDMRSEILEFKSILRSIFTF